MRAHAVLANIAGARHTDRAIAALVARGLTNAEAVRFVREQDEADEAVTLRRVGGVEQLVKINNSNGG